MKFRCERDTLVRALATAGRAAANRGVAQPVLSGVRFELVGDRLKLTGSDNDLTIEVQIEVAGEQDGIAVMPSKIALDLVRSLGDPRVEVSIDEDQARITAGRFESSLRVLPADEYPRFSPPADHAVTLGAKDLVQALSQVVPAASSDDSRPILTGVLLAAEEGGLRLVATDSYRLAVRDLPGTSVLADGQSVLVPSRALKELQGVLSDAEEVTLRLGERDVAFEVEGTRVTSTLLEGDFPSYRGLIPPRQPNRLTVNREDLLNAVKRVKLMARETNTPVRLSMSAEGLELVAITQEVGQAHEQIDGSFEGEDLTVAFNPEYLMEGIDATNGDEIFLDTVDAQKPAVIRPGDGGDFLYLLMPVRV
ncbi:MAG: DNA polymerase III subunit beta [Acidimicrobiales bacterium]|nr:DNA polymerase III subunit beta [Acidimicrobiales bacterium]